LEEAASDRALPGFKKKARLAGRAWELPAQLERKHSVFSEDVGATGKRNRRTDGAGTPGCATFDFATIEKDGTFTLRERDSMPQRRPYLRTASHA